MQLWVQRYKIRRTAEKEGMIDLVEKLIPARWIQRFHGFAESSFYLFAKATCALCLSPLIFSEGKFQKASPKRLKLHYVILSLVAMNTSHKFFITAQRLGAGQLDILTYVCFATFLTLLVTFSVGASNLLLPDETMDILNGWSKILSSSSCQAESNGRRMSIVVNTKAALVITAQAIMTPIIAISVSGVNFVLDEEPLSLYATSRAVGLIPQDSQVPNWMSKLLHWPFEFATYLLPLISAVWAAQTLVLVVVDVLHCVENLR